MATFYFRRSDQDFDLNVATLVGIGQEGKEVQFTLIGSNATCIYKHVTAIRKLYGGASGWYIGFDRKRSDEGRWKDTYKTISLATIDTIIAEIEL